MTQFFMTELPSILKAGRNIKSGEMEVFYNDILFFLYIAGFHCLVLDRLAKLRR